MAFVVRSQAIPLSDALQKAEAQYILLHYKLLFAALAASTSLAKQDMEELAEPVWGFVARIIVSGTGSNNSRADQPVIASAFGLLPTLWALVSVVADLSSQWNGQAHMEQSTQGWARLTKQLNWRDWFAAALSWGLTASR